MKKILLALPIVVALVAQSQGANVVLSNFDDTGAAARPIALSNGTLLPVNTGAVSIGTFGTLTDAQITALGGTGRNALLADFIAFADSVNTPTPTGDANAFNFPGLYSDALNQPVNTGDPKIGKGVYTFIGNGATLAASSQIAILKDSQSFAVDAPLATAQAYIHEAANTVLLIGAEGPLTAVPGLGSFNTLQLAVVPEPSSLALLGLCALAFRRRR